MKYVLTKHMITRTEIVLVGLRSSTIGDHTIKGKKPYSFQPKSSQDSAINTLVGIVLRFRKNV